MKDRDINRVKVNMSLLPEWEDDAFPKAEDRTLGEHVVSANDFYDITYETMKHKMYNKDNKKKI